MGSHAYIEDIVYDRDDRAPGGETMSDDNRHTDQRICDTDWEKFRKIIKDDVQASADDIKASIPKPTSPWVAVVSAVGLTATIIGTLGSLMVYAIGKDNETRTAMLASIKESVKENTAAIGSLNSDVQQLSITFAKLDGTVSNLNTNFQGLLFEIKGEPANGLGHGDVPKPSATD